ncbi:MAG: ATP-grasp domain-containing protein [Vicinamibacteria bacterium]
MNARVILLASSRSYRNDAFLSAARRLGLEIVSGADVPLPLLPQVRHGLPLDYRDLERSTAAIVRHARRTPVRAVLGVDDSGSLLAARAAAELGLAGNDPESVACARDKRLMRRRFAAAAVPQPAFVELRLDDDPQPAARAVGFPCVIKPTLLSGSRGVMRADDPGELGQRWRRLRRILAGEGCGDALVEGFVPGSEVALEGLLDGGSLHVLALFDKPDPLDGPFFEETIYVTPSRLAAEVQAAIAGTAAAACAALGLRHGPVHAELRVNDRGPFVVEVAARSIGGLCSKTLRFGSAGTSLEELILRQAVGLPKGDALSREAAAGGVMMIPIPRAGILRSVGGVEDARAVPLVEEVTITAPLQNRLVPLPEGDAYLGFVFARGERPREVEAALREAHARLRFEIAPDVPLQPA